MPLFDPDDPQHYASIHSNPPGRQTEYAGLTLHAFGQGRCLYLASPVMAQQQDAQQSFTAWLLQTYAPPALVTNTDAPAAVEVTVLESATQKAVLACLVNYQKELPNIPVAGVSLELTLEGLAPTACRRVSDGHAIPFTSSQGKIRFEVAGLETLEMVEICF